MQSFIEGLQPEAGHLARRSTSIGDWRISEATPMYRIKVYWSPVVVPANRTEDFQAAAREIAMLRKLQGKQAVPELLDTRFSNSRRLVSIEAWHDTLHDVIAGDKLPADNSVVSGLAWAIMYLHQSSLMHCNLTPRGVLVTRDRRAPLTDFG